jgi:hypothetical protein
VAAPIAATDRVSANVTIVRDIAVAPGETDNSGSSCVIRIAETVAAIIRNNHDSAAQARPTALPAAPGGFGHGRQ